ncbi:MAG TPA: zf-HC2 domain-containing protein [Longimicrobiales bacterium]|nr:zf-HC2 domain-containing protein [Longimicrobiales bacterium]
MHDPWMDRLSEYLDGDLASEEARALEEHLVGCDACTATMAELRAVMARVSELSDAEPARDLWAGIAAGIAEASPADVRVIPFRGSPAGGRAGRTRRGAGWRLSFTMPGLAAAAIVLVTLSAGAMWWLSGAGSPSETAVGAIVQTSNTPSADARLVGAGPPSDRYTADTAELEAALAAARDQLDPVTVEVIERSLESIDQAIADARAALDADPDNPFLTRQLDNTMQRRLDVLRRAGRVQRAGT